MTFLPVIVGFCFLLIACAFRRLPTTTTLEMVSRFRSWDVIGQDLIEFIDSIHSVCFATLQTKNAMLGVAVIGGAE